MRGIGFIETTSVAAFVTDHENRILKWNAAAERLLGSPASDVVGSRCFEAVASRDPFGNLFCGRDCSVRRMARRREPIHPFEVVVHRPTGETLALWCSIIITPGPRSRHPLFVHLLERDRALPEAGAPDPADLPPDCRICPALLTSRERAVLNLLAAGSDTTAAARAMGISIITVRNHVQHILDKLHVHSRLQAVALARREHLI